MLATAFSAFPVLRSEQERYAAVPASASMLHAVPGFPSAIGVLLLLSCFEFIKEVKSEQFLASDHSTKYARNCCTFANPCSHALAAIRWESKSHDTIGTNFDLL